MKPIITLALNPTIDAAFEVDRFSPTSKLRSHAERYDPGGGGINVARVICRFGGSARIVLLSGGPLGTALTGMLDQHQLLYSRIPTAADTRLSATIFERETGQEYRIVGHGSPIAEADWQACLDLIAGMEFGTLIASGSLPPGAPADFFARAGALAGQLGADFVLDSSGDALRLGLEPGGVMLVKPSRGEMRQLAGLTDPTINDLARAAQDLVARDKARMVAVTLGTDGALLASRKGISFLPAVAVETRSAVGAGDSFLGAMVFALANGETEAEAFRFAIAAGAAAVLHPGTSLCHPEDCRRLLARVPAPTAQ